jgi:hypothetical protein
MRTQTRIIWAAFLIVAANPMFPQQGITPQKYVGRRFEVTVPIGWLGYWGEDLKPVMVDIPDEMKDFEFVFLFDQQIDLDGFSLDDPPQEFGFIYLMMGTLPEEESGRPEQEWADNFYTSFQPLMEDNVGGETAIGNRTGYFMAGTLLDFDTDNWETQPTGTDIYIAAARTEDWAFIINCILPKAYETDIVAFMEMLIGTISFR